MKAVVFHKPKDIRVETVDDPVIQQDRDAIIRVSSTAICGSDLHIYNGLFPQSRPMILGHEFVGVIEETGKSVSEFWPGDRVIVPFPIACGQCWFCRNQLPTHCENSNPDHYGPQGGILQDKGGALFGYTDLYGGYPGGQAEYVRVPYADYGLRKIPAELQDDQVIFITDILSTGWAAIDWAGVTDGMSVAVFGRGPVGLMALKCARYKNADELFAVDVEEYRLDNAEKLTGAVTINANHSNPVAVIRDMTEGRGADVVIDAVGMEARITPSRKVEAAAHLEAGTIQVLLDVFASVRRGGSVSVVGVYGTAYDNFPWGQVFEKGLHIHAGQAPVHRYMEELVSLVQQKKIIADDIISHRCLLDDAPAMYQAFNKKENRCVKVVMKPGAAH